MQKVYEKADLFALGGGAYGLIEVLWRGYTHWTMLLLGGAMFLAIGMLNALMPRASLLRRGLVGGAMVTAAEFATGCVVNLQLGLGVWDYSDMPFNILGQICLPFTVIWLVLAIVAIILDDYLRYWIFGEEKPHYNL